MARTIEKAPFLGMHTVDHLQGPGHCDLALNVDVSAGQTRTRPGFFSLQRFADHRVLGLYCYIAADGARYILVVTCDPPTDTHLGQVLFRVFNGDGNHPDPALPIQDNLSLKGQYPTLDPYTFAEMGDRVYFTNGQGLVWMWEPRFGGTARAMTMENGLLVANWMYLATAPVCGVVLGHDTLMVYAKLLAESNATINGTIPADQDVVDRQLMADYGFNQSILSYTDRNLLFSDKGAPNNIALASNIGTYDSGPVTGVASYEGTLYVFTSHTIHRIVGLNVGADFNFEIHKVSDCVGCVAHATIQAIPGLGVAFLAHDGVHVVNEDGELLVSEEMQRIFQETWEPTVPRSLWTRLREHGFPWRLDRSRLSTAAAVVSPSQGFYLLSLPLRNVAAPGGFVMAWNFRQKAWALWGPSSTSAFRPSVWSKFSDKPDEIYFGTADTTGVLGRLVPWGHRGYTDRTTTDTAVSIAMVYVSRRHGMGGDESHKQVDEVKVRCRGAGRTSITLFVAGEESQYDRDTTADTELTERLANITLHPGADAEPEKIYFWSKFNWGPLAVAPPPTPGSGVLWTPAGRVTRRRTINAVSRWYQYALVDLPTSGGNYTEVFGISTGYEVLGEEP